MMAGLDKPTSGQIVVCGKHIEKLNERKVTLLRQKYIEVVLSA